MKEQILYRLEVAPLMILPLARSPFFSYASDTSVPKGSLVSISFGKQMGEGIVYDSQILPGRKPIWMKYIEAVAVPKFLTDEQCELALAVSEEYFTPLGKVLKHFLPKRVKERTTKKKIPRQERLLALRPTKVERSVLENPLIKEKGNPLFLDTSLEQENGRLLSLLTKEVYRSKQQTLIIVPEITLLPLLMRTLCQYFPLDAMAVLHSKLSDGAYFSAWERIRSGEAEIIISTRQGLFAPFRNLGLIIITEEQDESYKQWDMSPRYHGKRVAEFLAVIHKTTLLFTSGTPSSETLARIESKSLLPLNPLPNHPPASDRLSIINLRLERYRKNYSPLSLELIQRIDEALTRREQILLYINRQGLSAFSVCERCKEVFRCKECEHPLVNTEDGGFHCLNCRYKTGSFPSCPSCGHLVFRHVGFGTEKIEREIRKRFPSARVARLDSSTQKVSGTLENIVDSGLNGAIDILIGTQMALKNPPLPNLSLVAMIDADSLLLFPDFQADERLFRDISRALRQTRVTTHGRVLVQTFHPEHAFFQKIATDGSTLFLQKLIAERRDLAYPPFARFMSLSVSGKTAAEAEKKAEKLRTSLEPYLEGLRMYPGKPVERQKKRGLFESQILIRFPETLPQALRTFLQKNNKDCIIDIDPLSLR